MAWASRTDVGKVRRVNEDSVFVAPGMFVVADGMGGHAAGDVASQLTVATFLEHVADEPIPIAELAAVIDHANASVLEHANEQGRAGMGTTVVGLALTDNGGTPTLVVFHVGDSRCYVCEDGQVRQITHDHSEVQELVDSGSITVEEAATHPHRNVVTRAIGIDPSVFADFVVLAPSSARRFLLCSDGVSGEVSFADIERVLCDTARSPDDVAEQLMAMVLTGRAADNASLIVVDVIATEGAVVDDADVTGPRARVADAIDEDDEDDADATTVVRRPLVPTSPWPPPVVVEEAPSPSLGIDSRPQGEADVIDDVPS